MTLKCWTSAIAQTPAAGGATGPAPSPATTSTSTSSASSATSASAAAIVAVMPMASAAPRSFSHGASTGSGLVDMRRRSVGFINTTALIPATGPLVTTPSRNANVHKTNRLRSMSSTWEASDLDDDDDAAEEKSGDTYNDQLSRRDLMYTQIASNLNQQNPDGSGSGGPHGHTPRRRGHHNSRSARSRRRRTMSESSGSTTGANNNHNNPNNTNCASSRRVRILTPVASQVFFGGWVRGQPAEVRWEVVDKSVHSVRIDVCNVAWAVPTTIASRVPNDGNFQWKRVYWGMPITEGYYVNIYDVSDVSPEDQQLPQAPSSDPNQASRPPDQPQNNQNNQTHHHHPNNQNHPQSTQDGVKTDLVLLARSDCFAVIG